MQKLLRLRALIQDSALSSIDVFVQPKKEPHPGENSAYAIHKRWSLTVLEVVQSPLPVIELTPQAVSISTSCTSPAQSVHSTSEEPLHRATKLLPKSLRRALSKSFSTLPNLMSKSISKDNTIWSDQDSFLPRAKPPPPLKRIKHARNRSENGESSPDPTMSRRPSTSHCGSSGQSLASYSTASRSSRRSLDVPSIEIFNEDSDQPADDVQHTLTRVGTRTTIASGASGDSDVIFASSGPRWQPPANWAGVSKVASADEGHRDRRKLGGWFTRKKGVESSSEGSSTPVPTRLNRVRIQTVRKIMPVRLADIGEPEEQETSVLRGRPLSVKIQCYEGDRWHEKRMADIIPKLRELRFK